MEPGNNGTARRPVFVRAFRPFWIALVLGAGILAVDFHLRNAPQTHFAGRVTVKGKGTTFDCALRAHGKVFKFGETVPIGPATVTVTAPDAEPREYSRFVWYGPNLLGDITLEPSRGTVEIIPQPFPNQFELKGQYESLTNTTGKFPGVMTGQYEATLVYGGIRRIHLVEVVRNETTTDKRQEKIGVVNLDSDPSKGTYELLSNSGTVQHSGNLPLSGLFLREGRYEAVVHHGEEERRQPFILKANETNRMVVRFTYGSLELTSEPSDATVLLKAISLGKTPLTLTHFATGKHSFQLVKAGFDPVWLEVEITEAATNKQAVVLVDTQYRQSMNAATQAFEANHFDQALDHLRTALTRKPDDKPALKLQNEAQAGLFRQEAAEAVRREEFPRALTLLDKALEMLPGDADTLDQKTQTVAAQKAFEKRTTEERLAGLQRTAASEIERDAFDNAESSLKEADKLVPEQSSTIALREKLKQARERWQAEESKRIRIEHAARRRTEGDASFMRLLAEEPDASSFPTTLHRTGKSLDEVLEALEKLAAAEKPPIRTTRTIYSQNREAMVKFGDLAPLFKIGTYVRVHPFVIQTGETEIRIKVFSYRIGQQGRETVLNQPVYDAFRRNFSILLQGDLK